MISENLAGKQVVDEETTQFNNNKVTIDEDFLDDMSATSFEAEDNELVGDVNLKEIEEDFPPGV